MVVKRGPDGNMIEEPTRATGGGSTRPASGVDTPTHAPGAASPPPRSGGGLGGDYDTPTIKRSTTTGAPQTPTASPTPAAPAAPPAGDSLEPATQIVGRQATPAAASSASDAMQDPPVGWLVVVDGPGRGETLRLGYGRNTLGRGPTTRLNIDFGDTEISRTAHCTVTYDPKTRKFYLNHEDGVNLTYLNEQPVLQPVIIERDARITIGATTLRFLPFCDEQFEWQDQDNQT